jgi:O-antigen ligase
VATLMARSRSRRTASLVALGALALLAIAATVLLPMVAALSDESLLASRIEGFEDDASTLERLYLLQASWDIFVSNPLLGGAIAEPVTHLYPHNIILEALMVGGIGLGLLITAIVAYCLKRAYALIAARDQRSFIGGIAIFTVIMAMTSGSLYTGPEFWYVFALLIAQHPGHNSDRRPPATNLQAP